MRAKRATNTNRKSAIENLKFGGEAAATGL
jgi:hypothetical protein